MGLRLRGMRPLRTHPAQSSSEQGSGREVRHRGEPPNRVEYVPGAATLNVDMEGPVKVWERVWGARGGFDDESC